MGELHLVVTLAGKRAAIPASDVQSVIELDGLTPVPRAPEHVAGLTALRSRVLTVIDCRTAICEATPPEPQGVRHAAVVEVDGHGYALMVDGIEDVVKALSACSELRADPGSGWSRVTRGVIETAIGPLPVVEIEKFVSGCPSRQAA